MTKETNKPAGFWQRSVQNLFLVTGLLALGFLFLSCFQAVCAGVSLDTSSNSFQATIFLFLMLGAITRFYYLLWVPPATASTS